MAGLVTSGLVLMFDKEVLCSRRCKSGERSTIIACVIPTPKKLVLIRFLPFPVSGLIGHPCSSDKTQPLLPLLYLTLPTLVDGEK